jgi:molybdopterin molybdotransferase
MISFDEALAIVGSAAHPLGTERIAVCEAGGRVLASPVVAAIDSPRADVSAMDGYAVRGADVEAFPVSLEVVGDSLPGVGWPGTVEPGRCVRIFTGAPLPIGADRIVIQEQVRRNGEKAIIEGDHRPATWVRPRGRDFQVGDEVLTARRLLNPAALIAAAGADVAEVDVFVRPRLAVLSNGDELVEPGQARISALAVSDSASIGVAALAEQWGGRAVRRERLRDNLAEMKVAARDAASSVDVIVVIGGASVGERDFAKAMFEPLGLELLFSKISIRPGKPAWFGRVGDTLVLGLPGNPTSALVTARLLLIPLLAAMQERTVGDVLHWEPARLGSPLPPCDLRETFHRARLAAGEVSLVGFQESHAQKALAEAEVLVRQRANSPAIPAGEMVQFLKL